MKKILSWLSYTPLAEREPWELEGRERVELVETPAAVWLRAL
jgi:hypothetical protein